MTKQRSHWRMRLAFFLIITLIVGSLPFSWTPKKASAEVSQTKWLTYDFNNFSGGELNQLFSVNGDATAASTVDGTVLRLTKDLGDFPDTHINGMPIHEQSGSIFNKQLIKPQNNYSFSTAFAFRMKHSGALAADGLTFTLQAQTSSARSPGLGLGYGGITPSFAVKYDTFYNGPSWGNLGDPSANYIGLATDGNVNNLSNPSSWVVNLDGTGNMLSDGTKYYSWIDYDGLNKNVKVYLSKSQIRPADPVLNVSGIDLGAIFAGNPGIYAGFTAATGAYSESHDILNWQFVNDYEPIDTENNTYKQAPTSVQLSTADTGIPGEYNVTATVLDANGQPVAGAPVTLTSLVGELKDQNGNTLGDLTSGADGKVSALLKESNPAAADTLTAVAVGGAYATEELPLTITTPDGSVFDTPAPQITGKAKAGSTVTVVIRDKNGNTVSDAGGAATADGNGMWTFTLKKNLPSGTYKAIAIGTNGTDTITQAMQFSVVDKSQLQNELNTDNSLTNDNNDYTTDSWTAFSLARQAANDVLNDSSSSQTDVNQALANLTNAKESLVKIAPKLVNAELKKTVDSSKIVLTFDHALQFDGDAEDGFLVLGNGQPIYGTVNLGDNPKQLILIPSEGQDFSTVDSATVSYSKSSGHLQGTNGAAVDDFTATAGDPFSSALQIAKPSADVVNTKYPQISGTAEPGSTVTVTIKDKMGNVVTTAPAPVDAEGHWTYTPSGQLKNGSYTAVATATNNDNKIASKTKEFNIVDKTVLQGAVTTDEALNPENYTKDSWEIFQTELKKAQSVLSDPEATQDEVDTALDDLKKVADGLTTDKSALQTTVNEINNEKLQESSYTTGSWETLQKALTEADNLLKDPNATQAQIDTALQKLTEAEGALVNTSALQAKVSETEKLDKNNYTTKSWDTLQKTFDDVNKVLNNPDSTQDEVNTALTELQKAMGELRTDKSALQTTVDELKSENLQETSYTTGSWKTLQDALNQAEKVSKDPCATQAQIDTALQMLSKAKEGLVNASDLQAKINEINRLNLKQNNYTEKSWAIFQTALKKSESLLTTSSTSQKQVDSALENLDQSQKSLVKVENNLSGKALPKTGDTNSLVTVSAGVLLILIGGIIAFLTRKRRKYTD
ncbi:lectin-like domain-containing protein [Sporolactobacillus laevolacticus]|uniref:lectin-like domain-containing protein n=1 Tax=Sporolactobacillus laevolacticus TaxID=33018 RepID=UPI0025B45F0F|nr:Ig-like domain-containing protein [Sporolactobacillus laevolacticus]MDN3954761.1 Ig-like domain-containing protein [Sporolactobacillus laevolacticus]